MPKAAIIIGASSGIGRALAYKLSAEGYALGLAARRFDLLQNIQQEIAGDVCITKMDVTDPEVVDAAFQHLAHELGAVELVIVCAGQGHLNDALDFEKERATIDVNVSGFAQLSCLAYRHFEQQGRGHLVGISSVAMHRGSFQAPAYNASKAFVSNYMEGLRIKAFKQGADIGVTDIRPGFVDTPMAQGDDLFWVASPDGAADQVYDAIKEKKSVAYITRRWWWVGRLLSFMPDWIYKRM